VKSYIVFMVPAMLLSVALVSGQSAVATVQSIPGVGPSGEDPYPEDTTWTYNSESGQLCSTTPDGQTNCQYVGEGRPCEDFEGQVECN
jgi:hypothetical protein